MNTYDLVKRRDTILGAVQKLLHSIFTDGRVKPHPKIEALWTIWDVIIQTDVDHSICAPTDDDWYMDIYRPFIQRPLVDKMEALCIGRALANHQSVEMMKIIFPRLRTLLWFFTNLEDYPDCWISLADISVVEPDWELLKNTHLQSWLLLEQLGSLIAEGRRPPFWKNLLEDIPQDDALSLAIDRVLSRMLGSNKDLYVNLNPQSSSNILMDLIRWWGMDDPVRELIIVYSVTSTVWYLIETPRIKHRWTVDNTARFLERFIQEYQIYAAKCSQVTNRSDKKRAFLVDSGAPLNCWIVLVSMARLMKDAPYELVYLHQGGALRLWSEFSIEKSQFSDFLLNAEANMEISFMDLLTTSEMSESKRVIINLPSSEKLIVIGEEVSVKQSTSDVFSSQPLSRPIWAVLDPPEWRPGDKYNHPPFSTLWGISCQWEN